MKGILVDQGSSADILFREAFVSMKLDKRRLSPFNEHLIEFSRTQVPVEGMIELSLVMSTPPKAIHLASTFVIVSAPSVYNAILGRPSFNAAQVVVSTVHLLMKFPTPESIGEVKANQEVVRQCYAKSLTKTTSRATPLRPPIDETEKKEQTVMNCEIMDLGDEVPQNHPQPSDEMEFIAFPQAPERVINICTTLPPTEKKY